MPSPWLAVGAETDPLVRARELQRSWERLLADGVLGPELPPEATAGLRPTIVESWQRSLGAGLDPVELDAPIEADHSEVRERWLEHPLGRLEHVLVAKLRAVAEESQSLVVVTDESGLLLHLDGPEWLQDRAREMNFLEGGRFSEAADGTNGIGTALAADHALQVFAFEHFNQQHHQWVCSGAPVHDPVSGRIVGLVDLTSLWKIAHPRSLELVTTAATTMERCLLDNRRDHDARLRRRYGDLMTRSTDLLVNRDGYVLDGDEQRSTTPLDVPEGGGEAVLPDGSVAIAESLGDGDAYLVRRPGSRGAKSAPTEALSRAEKRARELATEQAALREVATLVARESPSDELFSVVAHQAARMFDVPLVKLVRYEEDSCVAVGAFSGIGDDPFPVGSRWPLDGPGVIASVRQSGRPARVENYADMPGRAASAVRQSGLRSTVASPIVVEGRLWGAMVVASPRREPLPDDTEARLADFTELVAMAIANAESRAAVGRLAQEQAALRRVATLVARGVSPDEMFSAVSNEVGRLFGSDQVAVARYEPDGSGMVYVGISRGIRGVSIGTRWPLEDFLPSTTVYRTGHSARTDRRDFETASGPIAASLREMKVISRVAAPIVVEGSLWGSMTVNDVRGRLPGDAEERVAKFTELVATAIANAQGRGELAASEARARGLAEEQAALRRVATLVAHAPSSEELFSAVAREVATVLNVPGVTVERFENDRAVVTVGAAYDPDLSGAKPFSLPPIAIGTQMPRDPGSLAAQVFETHGTARVDAYSALTGRIGDAASAAGIGSGVAGPIFVDGELWGQMCVFSTAGTQLPVGTENRLHDFTELVGIAIANAESRAKLSASEARAQDLAREQAGLRRVATLVAKETKPDEVFAAVAQEVAHVFGVELVTVCRYEFPDILVLSSFGGPAFPAGSRWSLGVPSLPGSIYRTGGPARIDDFSTASGLDAVARDAVGVKAAVGVPIVVDGAVWGSVNTASTKNERFPTDTEERLARFTDLVATSVANAIMREELAASRARVIAAADGARRRIERDLHDGAQQQLVTLMAALRTIEATIPTEPDALRADVSRVADGLATAVHELRELSRGIHPAVLTEGGLAPALKALKRRSAVRVTLDVRHEHRLPDQVEAAAYYSVSEALTNASRHASASRVWISLDAADGALSVSVRDDGVGGADASRGSGLTGLKDRIEAVGGTIHVESPPGSGTTIEVQIPIV